MIGLLRNNKSGYRGVHFVKNRGFYLASISKGGRSSHIGIYGSAASAAAAYDQEAKKHFGKFARTNKSMGLL